MKTIILGKEGNQPFSINEDMDGVSRKHAQITITDNGDWYLKDLGSTNGTAIRNEKTGELIPISGKQMITPMTFIFLGPDNSRGCCFFAKQAVSYGDFIEDHQYLISKEGEFSAQLDVIDKKTRLIKWLIFAINLLIVGITWDGGLSINFLRVGTILSTFFMAIYDANGAKKKVNGLREKFSHCPNPCCSKKQTAKEIMDMRCSKCKK